MVIKRVRHICIVVRDMKKMIEFYQDLLGFTLRSNQTYSTKELSIGLGVDGVQVETSLLTLDHELEIELTQYLTHPQEESGYNVYDVGYRHIALIVENIEECYKEIIDYGLSAISEPVFIERKDGKKLKFFYFRDPEGNILEFNEFI